MKHCTIVPFLFIFLMASYELSGQNTGSCKVEMFLLKSSKSLYNVDWYKKPTVEMIADKPLLNDSEIIAYEVPCDSNRSFFIKTSCDIYSRIEKLAGGIPLTGLSFIFTIDRIPFFAGFFWSSVSSSTCNWIQAYPSKFGINVCLGDALSSKYYDPRKSLLFKDCLKRTGKLK